MTREFSVQRGISLEPPREFLRENLHSGQNPREFLWTEILSRENGYIGELYSKSPFLAADTDHFLDPHGMEEHQE
ncbi:unnamed protein product [Camellia sinensis]